MFIKIHKYQRSATHEINVSSEQHLFSERFFFNNQIKMFSSDKNEKREYLNLSLIKNPEGVLK